MEKKTLFTLLLVFMMLLTGSINTISKKIGYNTCSQGFSSVISTSHTSSGCDAGERKFRKPWTQSLVMFFGEMMCLFVFAYNFFQKKRNQKPKLSNHFQHHTGDPEVDGIAILTDHNEIPETKPEITWSSCFVCLLPSLCDVGGTTLSGIGLLFTSASVFQMLRGSIILFTATFSIFFLKRKVLKCQWFGISITVIGIVLVGTASFIGSSNSSSDSPMLVLVGNLLVIISQIMSAFQMVIEEKFLKKRNLPPEFVVGCEGVFGALTMICIVLPIVYNIPFTTCTSDWCRDGEGIHEDSLDSIELIKNNSLLLFFVLLYWISISFYNFCGLAVAKRLTSVHRTLIDACRTIVVWIVDIIIYQATNGSFGEEWETKSGLIQLTGFVLMLLGTMIHNKIIKIPALFDYDEVIVTQSVLLDESAPLLPKRSSKSGYHSVGNKR
eukprot:c18876_g1_i1.p1 GENE.c18876_g1_i1~~c18876_g1_i1.p1  ORF type:complete len:439 (+),score=162.51 c18876_g1_i1:78-1394(+)